jgi:DNA/RNA-binding domain of Phe-tRNA-synthetase-like protein
MKRIIIRDDVFELFPGFYRGVVLVHDVSVQKSYKPIRRLLRQAIDRRAGEVGKEPTVEAWNEAHRRFGSDPDTYPPSIRSLLERVCTSPNLPFINSVVALFNYTSLTYLIPAGGDDVERVEGNLVLGRATGDERFVPLGGGDEERPEPGEVIYFDDGNGNVLCRRWNWRNGDVTKIDVASKKLVINLDGLPPATPELIEEARGELARLLEEHAKAKVTLDALHRDRRELPLPW